MNASPFRLLSLLPAAAGVIPLFLSGALPLRAAVVSQSFEIPIAPNTRGYLGHYPQFGNGNGVIYQHFWVASPYGVDMDGNGTTDLTFEGRESPAGANYMTVSLRGSNQVRYTDGIGLVALLSGTLLGPLLPDDAPAPGWRNDNDLGGGAVLTMSYGASQGGIFAASPSSPRFLGVRFERDGALHYGWMALSSIGPGRSVFIHQWAWETEPGKAIIVGQIPEPSAALLGAGATAALVFRRRRRCPAS